MKEMLIILPTRNRPDNLRRFYDAWKENTCGKSRVVVMADTDDPNDYSYTGWTVERNKRFTPIKKTNLAAKKYLGEADVIAYIGDDAVIETKNFEDVVFKMFGDNELGVIYGENHINFHVPDHPFITRKLYQKTGWFFYPKLFHSWCDFIWDDIGKFLNEKELGIYCKATLLSIRNLHPYHVEGIKGDVTYDWLYRQKVADKDKVYYDEWLKNGFIKLQAKLCK